MLTTSSIRFGGLVFVFVWNIFVIFIITLFADQPGASRVIV